MVAAQQYPSDFDGILAGAPALNWTEYVIAELWPQVAMNEANYFPTPLEFQAVTQLVTEACDGLDGVKDVVISDLKRCHFDPSQAVGRVVTVGNDTVTVSDKVASIVRAIWEGPKTASGEKLWVGLNKGASPTPLAQTTEINGSSVGVPFFVPQPWVQYFVKQNPMYDLTNLSSAGLRELFAESVAKFSVIMDSANPDLSAFQRAGGKLISWQGEADQLIFPQDTVEYYKTVQSKNGRSTSIDDFFRLFLAPGVDHCNGGTTVGAGPTDPFGALRAWVEKGTAPDELVAASAAGGFTRKLCRWPLAAKYNGHGDTKVAASFTCVPDSCR